MPTADAMLDDIRRIAGEVSDPEIPVLTIADLGVLRDVRRGDDEAHDPARRAASAHLNRQRPVHA